MDKPTDIELPAIDRLPEELLVHILTYLNSSAPTERKLRQEPGLRLTQSLRLTLKNVSLVSVRWRRVALPLLFRYARLNLNVMHRGHGSASCSVCSEGALNKRIQGGELLVPPDDVDKYHLDMVVDAVQSLANTRLPTRRPVDAPPAHDLMGIADLRNISKVIPRLYHSLAAFIGFIQDQHLINIVESFALETNELLAEKLCQHPHRASMDRDWRYRAAAAFWQHLLSVLDPERVLIVAPPTDLAALTNCSVDNTHEWAFSDMDFHILELRQSRSEQSPSLLCSPVDYHSLAFTPHRYPGLAESSVLNLRSWSAVSVNEGSFLKAYGTYEFFERGPPSLVYSIKDCLTPRPIFSPHSRISDTPLASLRSFTYTAIFPFANHLDLRDLIPQLEVLDMQLAPDPQSNILDSKERVGKAELEDCWSELISTYQGIAGSLASFRISKASCPRLKRFVCRDARIPAMQEELDEVFIPLCLPVWAEYEPGVFTRLAMSAETMGLDLGWQ